MRTQCFINGQDQSTDSYYSNLDPSTGLQLGEIARGGAREVSLAIDAARQAQESWVRAAPAKRADVFESLAKLIRANLSELTKIESEDTGKPLSQARADVLVCARYFEFYGRVIESFYGDYIPAPPGERVFVTREPHGVVGSILAWNYPLQLFARAVAPAVITGNAIVVKPADETPRTAILVAKLATEAGLPPGVLNVVTGFGSEAGAALVSSSEIDHIGFVGSTETGRLIAGSAAQNLIPSVLELGGKSPHIVFQDANLEEVVPAVVKGIINNAGQTCSAGSRLLVDQRIHRELVDRIATVMAATTVGPADTDPDLGPLISPSQLRRVQGYVDGVDGEVLSGGSAVLTATGGNFFAPTIIDNVDPASRIAQEEVFGPVLVATPFASVSEAVAIANSTDYGLLGAVWTQDIDRALTVAEKVRAGQVYINSFGSGNGGVEIPFGGFRQSGYGREKGTEALLGMTRTKATIIRVSDAG